MVNTSLTYKKRPPAVLYLEDGTIFRGRAFGALNDTGGEVVFNTAMTGYQEVLTDPSYYGQIVCMTYPQIGNYGVNEEDVESDKIQVAGFIIKEPAQLYSNWRAKMSLEEWMISQGIVGLCWIDTRALVRKLREAGVMRGIICPDNYSKEQLEEKLKAVPSMAGADLVQHVTAKEPYVWKEELHKFHKKVGRKTPNTAPVKIVAIDYGVKRNILRHLAERASEVHVVPATASAEEIMAMKPDGVFLSNGPGDPSAVTYGIETVKNLVGKVPVFGICLGHQILGLAMGGTTYKLKFGHRGANHPVQFNTDRKIDITSQNHGFCVTSEGMESKDFKVTHMNINDNTVAGLESDKKKCFSVQYHPEASPGPNDAAHHFDRFIEMLESKEGKQ